jgi:LysM repeat protein
LLNATVGVRRAVARVRPDTTTPSSSQRLHRRSIRTASAIQAHIGGNGAVHGLLAIAATIAALRSARPSLQRALPVGVAALVFGASAVSFMPSQSAAPIGGTTADGSETRLAIGGGFGIDRSTGYAIDGSSIGLLPEYTEGEDDVEGTGFRPLVPGPIDVLPDGAVVAAVGHELAGPFLADGTYVAGFAPDTTIEDGKALFRRYRVRSGDTLTGIARKHDVSMMTVWWANDLKSKDDLFIGQWLTIPPVSGLVVEVGAGDTLEALAAKHQVAKDDILEANGLTDPNLIVGQTLVVPGALGKGIATPRPTPRPQAATKPRTSSAAASARRHRAGSSSPAGSRTAAATRSGSPTAPACPRPTTTCRASPLGVARASARVSRSGAWAAPAGAPDRTSTSRFGAARSGTAAGASTRSPTSDPQILRLMRSDERILRPMARRSVASALGERSAGDH